MKRRVFLALVLVAFACVGCANEEAGPGVMLVLSVPAEVEADVSTLRVIVRSGAKGEELKERADEIVQVDEWPAEVFLRPTDMKRAWEAEIWARNEEDENVAAGLIDGWFMSGPPLRLNFALFAASNIPRDAGASGGSQEASAGDATAREASTATNDTGQDAGPRDAGMQQPRDARAGDEQPVTPPMESGTPVDAGRDARAQEAGTGATTQQDASEPAPIADASGGACSTAPAYPQDTACQRCTCKKCATQVTSCAASTEATKNTLCLAARSCSEKNTCMGQGCYCGSSLLCLDPDGPCLQEIQAAAGGSDLTAVQNASMDTASPLGRWVAVGECQLQNCRSECQL